MRAPATPLLSLGPSCHNYLENDGGATLRTDHRVQTCIAEKDISNYVKMT